MEEIKGYVAHIIYRNEENAYTVFELDYGKGSLTCTGFPPAISEGESCRVEGEMTSHPVYGDQMRISSYEAAMRAAPSDWNYSVPGTSLPGYYMKTSYDYFLVRGFAIVESGGIGTYGSEGFELCGTHQERDCHKCVVEWLAGNRSAFTDKENRIEIKADWCNGSVAMTGVSYGGTLPFEVATTVSTQARFSRTTTGW